MKRPVAPPPEEAVRHAKYLAALNTVAATVSQSLDLEITLNTALDQALEVINIEAGGISLVDEQAGELVMRVHRGWRQKHLADVMRIKLGEGMSGQVINSGQVLVTGSVYDDDPRLAVPAFGREGVQAMALAPMRAHGKVVGILSTMSYQPHTFSPDDIQLLAAIADQVGVAIDHAHLYQDTRRQLDELTTLHEVSLAAIYAAHDLAEAIKRIVKALQQRLGFEYVGLFLVNESQGTAELYATSTKKDERGRNVRIPLGQGIVGNAAASGQPLRVGDVEQEPRHLSGIHGVRSEMAVPLKVGGNVIGAIDVQSRIPNAFTPDDERVLVTVAGQLAIILENVRLYAETRRQLSELRLMSEVALAGASTLDLAQVLDRMLQVIRRTLNFETFEFILVDPVSRLLHTEASYGLPAQHSDLVIGQGIPGWVSEHGQPLRLANVQHDTRYIQSNPYTRSELAVPLKVGQQIIGVMNAESPHVDRFSPEDQHLLEVLAGQLAIIIQNARLHAETQRRLTHVSTLYTLARELSTSLDMNIVLDSIVNALKRVLKCRAAIIWLHNRSPDGERASTSSLEIRAAAGLQTKWKRGARLEVGEGIIGQVANTAQPVYVKDTHALDVALFDPTVRSLLCVPLIACEVVIGVLAIDSTNPHAFTADDELLLTITAAQASVAIENARLFEGVTERAQKLEMAYHALQQVDRVKDELVQNFSHELKTPLTFIKGYVELLLEEKTLGKLNKKQRDSLHIVADKTNILARLFNDVVLLQHIQHDTLQLDRLDISAMVQQAILTYRSQTDPHKLSLDFVATDGLLAVWADRDRVNQVLDNLLDNAIKFSPDGGQITIRLQDKGNAIQITVSDTGIGIPPEAVEKVFERFYQVDGSSTRRFGGTGLGLAIVKRIIEAHNGRVWVESQVGQGSSFHFTLPKNGLIGHT